MTAPSRAEDLTTGVTVSLKAKNGWWGGEGEEGDEEAGSGRKQRDA